MTVKTILTLTGDVEIIFKLQIVNLALNIFLKILSNFKQSTTETILKDSSEFNNTLAASHKDVNYIINSEKRATYLWKILTNKNGISEKPIIN